MNPRDGEVPELDPILDPRARGEDTEVRHDERVDREPESEHVDPEFPDRIADVVAPKIVDVRRLDRGIGVRIVRAEDRVEVDR